MNIRGGSLLALVLASVMITRMSVAADQFSAGPANNVSNTRIDVFFTPEDDALTNIISAIDAAKHSVRVQAYLFTSRKIANALIRAHRRHVDVVLIIDREQLEKGGASSIADIAAAGIPVHVDGQHAAAHNKIILIDAETEKPIVITGSYNFTIAAQSRNAENLLMIRGDHRLANAYRRNWENHREHSVRMQ